MNTSTNDSLSGAGAQSASPVTSNRSPAATAAEPVDARKQLLLEGPAFGTILHLAAPTVVGALAQMLAIVLQMYLIGMLGVEAFAGVTLVFPCLTLMQVLSNGGIGAGVASAVARSLGAGRKAEAEALALNAVVLGTALGIMFMIAELLFGSMIYRLMGGSGTTLAAGLAYSQWIFSASVFVWVLNLLASALIGSGNTMVPPLISILALAAVPLSAVLMFGGGPIPPQGIAGAGIAFACYVFLAAVALIAYTRSTRTTLRLPFDLRLLNWRLMGEILRVGGPSCVSAAIPMFSLMLITSVVARFGDSAVAGFGIAIRVDFVLLPLYISICTGVLPMVGTNVGAKQIQRARQIAWTGAFIAASIGGAAGLLLVAAPQMWMRLFSSDLEVLAAGALYLHIMGALYPVTAFGIVLGAAAQGAGRPLWPLVAVLVRVIIASGGGWLIVVGLGYPVAALYAMAALAAVIHGVILGVGHYSGRTIPNPSEECRAERQTRVNKGLARQFVK